MGSVFIVNSWSGRAASALIAASLLSGCGVFKELDKKPDVPNAEAEMRQILAESARKAASARVALANFQAVGSQVAAHGQNGVASVSTTPPAPVRGSANLVNLDYVGPVDSSLRILTSQIGWGFEVAGHKRSEIIVNLKHEASDSLVILRDIGAQCGKRCEVSVEVVEGGQSSVVLTFKDV